MSDKHLINSRRKAKSRIAVITCCYIVVSGNLLFGILIDSLIGFQNTFGQFLMLAFFWGWIALLWYVERKYFKGLYEQFNNEE